MRTRSRRVAPQAANKASKLPELYLKFHGRVLEHLGVQMYQSPVNALAEFIANAWDADSDWVRITIPTALSIDATFAIADGGCGMSLTECQDHFLNIGRNRRKEPHAKTTRGRTVLGRKGIGKFAGFGIARLITVDTISKTTGERTKFALDLDKLMTGEYVSAKKKLIDVLEYEPPDAKRAAKHGTTVTLERLTIKILRAPEQFATSMSRRFLMLKQQAAFDIVINGQEIPDTLELAGVEWVFPRDYSESERGDEIIIEDGWGVEDLGPGKLIRWRFMFLKNPIEDPELRGVAIYAGIKLAQRPFFFNITQGTTAQHGMEYLAGQVQAEFIDQFKEDVIATERQRIDWDRDETRPLLQWGQKRLRPALRAWSDRRAAVREQQLEDKIADYSQRLAMLPASEAKTLKRALKQLAKIPALADEQFQDTARAILTAWEGGRLQELISQISEAEEMNESQLLAALFEVDVLTALHVTEAVQAKLMIIHGLHERLKNRELENKLRDYIAEHPWLVAPQWETFRVETGLKKLCEAAAEESKWSQQAYAGRVDLTLAAGTQLLLIEFMRPGEALDYDHLSRFNLYVRTLENSLKGHTKLGYEHVTAYLIADKIEKDPVLADELFAYKARQLYAMDWETLLNESLTQWQDLLAAMTRRTPNDPRVRDRVADLQKALGITIEIHAPAE